MASRKEYELLFRLGAELEGSYNSTFKNAQKELQELGKLQSDISSYQRQQEAITNSQDKLKRLNTEYDALQNRLTATNNYSKSLAAEMQQLKNAAGADSAENAKLVIRYRELETELSKTAKESAALEEKISYKRAQIEKTVGSISNYETKLKTLDNELIKAGVDTSKLSAESERLGAEYNALITKQSEAEDGASSFGSESISAFNEVRQVLAGAGYAKILKELYDALMECADAAIEFESAMTGVVKTTDLSDAELSALSEEIKELATVIPVATTELASIGEVAGQLGIAKEDLLSFTTVMSQLATATTMTADEAATMLAQLANITQMDPSYYSNLASAIVDLGNNYATTEQKITDMAQGIAASASLAGMSEADIVALSAAVTSLGIEAQAGSTAMSSLISEISTAVETGEDLKNFAAIAGMSANEFKTAWGENAVSALQLFITGLSDTERNGKSATVALKDLGITETRMQRMILSLSNSGDLMNRTLETANKAWAENTALQNEAEKRYNTTESKITMLNNAWNNLAITIGDYVTPLINEFNDTLTDRLVDLNNRLTGRNRLDKVMEEIADSAHYSSIQIESASGVADAYITRLQELETQGLNTADAQSEYHNILEQLCATVPTLTDYIDLETNSIIGGTEALLENTEAWKANALQQIYQTKYKAELDAYAEKQFDLAEAQSNLNKRTAEHSIALATEAKAYDALYSALGMTKEEYNKLTETEKANLNIRLTLNGKGQVVKDLTEASETAVKTLVAVEQAEKSVLNAQSQLDDAAATVAEAEQMYQSFIGATKEETKAMDAQSSSALNVNNAITSITDKIALLSAAYTESYNAALASIGGQYDIWDEAAEVVATSSYTINKALESQVTYWQRYNTNLAKLRERSNDIEGLNELIASFADGSAESVNAVVGMANASDTELAKMVANWQELQEEQKTVSDIIANMGLNYPEQIAEMQKELEAAISEMNMSDAAAQQGIDTIQGFIKGAEGMIPEVERAYAKIAEAAARALKEQTLISVYGKDTYGGRWMFDPNYIEIPAHASGTLNAEDAFLAGEYGPELIIGARGSTVFPASETQKIIDAVAEYQEYVNLIPLYTAMNAIEGHRAGETLSAENSIGNNRVLAPSFTVNYNISGEVTDGSIRKLESFNDDLRDFIYDVIDDRELDRARRAYD